MALSNQQNVKEVDITKLVRTLHNSFSPIIILAIFFGAITFFACSMSEQTYTSEARIELIPIAFEMQNKDGVTGQKINRKTIDDHVEKIQSSDLLLKVAEILELEKQKEFKSRNPKHYHTTEKQNSIIKPETKGLKRKNIVLSFIRERLKVLPTKDGRYISIKFLSSNKELAISFNNILANLYYDTYLNDLLFKAQIAKENYKSSEPIQNSLKKKRMEELNERLNKISTELGVARSKWMTARDLNRSNRPENLSKVKNLPVIEKLYSQHRLVKLQIREAQAVLSKTHPILEQLESEAAQIQNLIRTYLQKAEFEFEQSFNTLNLKFNKIRNDLEKLELITNVDTETDEKLSFSNNTLVSKNPNQTKFDGQSKSNNISAISKNSLVNTEVKLSGVTIAQSTSHSRLMYTLFTTIAVTLFGFAGIIAKEIMSINNVEYYKLRSRNYKTKKHNFRTFTRKIAKLYSRYKFKSKNSKKGPVDLNCNNYTTLNDLSSDDNNIIKSISSIILKQSKGISGYRTIITGDHQAIDVTREGILLAHFLSQKKTKVVVINWNTKGEVSADQLGIVVKANIHDLLKGDVEFKAIIAKVPDSNFHFIEVDNSLVSEKLKSDSVGINAIFDALDELYDHIIVMGSFNAAQTLLRIIQARLSKVIIITENSAQTELIENGTEIFAGFNVSNIDIMKCLKSNSSSVTSMNKKAF